MNDKDEEYEKLAEIAIDRIIVILRELDLSPNLALRVCINLLSDMIINISLDSDVDIKPLMEEIGKDITDAVYFKLKCFKKGVH